jgi:hypothetical protein
MGCSSLQGGPNRRQRGQQGCGRRGPQGGRGAQASLRAWTPLGRWALALPGGGAGAEEGRWEEAVAAGERATVAGKIYCDLPLIPCGKP